MPESTLNHHARHNLRKKVKKGQPINIKESLTVSNKSQSSYKNLIKTSKNDKGKKKSSR